MASGKLDDHPGEGDAHPGDSYDSDDDPRADEDGGGQVEGTDILSTGETSGDRLAADGAGGAAWVTPAQPPALYRQGLRIRKLSISTIRIGAGSVVVNGVTINKSVQTVLDLATGAHWIGGSSNEPTLGWVHVYADESGNLLLHHLMPNQSAPSTANLVCEMRVNESGWDGTAGNGLNETSMIYDDGAGGEPTGEGDIAAGMLLGVYSDSAYSTGRGKATGAGASANDMSFARITAVDTGTNTLTLAAGHEIAINDNDYLTVIEDGMVLYRYETATWYRWMGAVYNAVSDLDDHYADEHRYDGGEASASTTTSTTLVSLGTDTVLKLITQGGQVKAHLHINIKNSLAGGHTQVGVSIDGADPAPTANEGYIRSSNPDASVGGREIAAIFTRLYPDLLPGTHDFDLMWKASGGTSTIRDDYHPQYWVKETPNDVGV